MQDPAATLDAGQQPGTRAVTPQVPQQPGGGVMKFVYASGARPLDGYTIKRGVGIGGFGEVYFATSDAGKEVALKRIQRNLDIELRGVRQCLNLKHINLISLFDIKYDDEGGAWVVMEYVTGESLKDVIDRNPNGMPLDDVESWFLGIAAGVAYLHDHGIVHRDLKPGNIFIDDDVVKIGDYGLSKFISCSRRSGQTESVGTFHYMAPEIGKGVYGKEIDVYALGIILYEMLTGRVPFEGESSQEIIMKHLTADPDLSEVQQPFRSVIERTLYKDPDKRFATVGDLLQRLDFDAARGRSQSAGAAPSRSRPPRSAPQAASLSGLSPVVDQLPNSTPRSGQSGPTAVHVNDSVTPIPPVVVAPPSGREEPLYITDDQAEDIVFGPVKHSSAGRPTRPAASSSAAPQRPSGNTAEEPIARAVQTSWTRTRSWWKNIGLSTPVKVMLLVGAIFLLVLNAKWLVPVAVVGGAVYLIYFGIRSLVLATGGGPRSRTTPSRRGQTQPATNRLRNERFVSYARQTLSRKTNSERVTELTGSMLMSAVVSAVMSLIVMILGGLTVDGAVDTWTFWTWLTVTSVVGSWTILGINKFWEGSPNEEQIPRRFVMLVAGLVLGTAAFGVNSALMIRMDQVPALDMVSSPWQSAAYAADGTPLLPAYLIYFGGLFVILRWWRQADPIRKSRLSLWATGVCALWGLVVSMLWSFPQPWGFMIAATISVAVQLSSPWMRNQDRAQLREQYQEA